MHVQYRKVREARDSALILRVEVAAGSTQRMTSSGEGVRAAGQVSARRRGGQSAQGEQEEGAWWGERQLLQLWICSEAPPAKGQPPGDVSGIDALKQSLT